MLRLQDNQISESPKAVMQVGWTALASPLLTAAPRPGSPTHSTSAPGLARRISHYGICIGTPLQLYNLEELALHRNAIKTLPKVSSPLHRSDG